MFHLAAVIADAAAAGVKPFAQSQVCSVCTACLSFGVKCLLVHALLYKLMSSCILHVRSLAEGWWNRQESHLGVTHVISAACISLGLLSYSCWHQTFMAKP